MINKYQKHEFCRDVECEGLRSDLNGDKTQCPYYAEYCLKTAKEFHDWLKNKGFKITKEGEGE